MSLDKRGIMVVIEGIDKAGKGTQAMLLSNALTSKGYRCKVISFPDYSTPIGKEIHAFLHNSRDYPLEVKHMLLSANRWEKKREIEQALHDNDCVIMNRYYQSNLAYGYANNLDLAWLENLDRGLPREDLVVVIDVSLEVSLERIKRERHKDEFENLDLLKRVIDAYKVLAKRYSWLILDGNRGIEDIHKDMLSIVIKLLSNYRV